ncbi:MAG TPA: thioredoxin domain-containing protein [Candidatus Hydrogenedentes bacterium]|nr:thioredoxin domain-containing protein [Candidatus Hydrogenedentota bacterium]
MRHYARIPRPVKAAALAVFMLLIAAVGTGYAEADEGIPWLTSLDAAKEQAAAQNKLIFMDVFAEWCGPCKMLASETFTAPEVIKALEAYIPLKIDSDKQPQVASRYGVRGVPTLFVLTAQGTTIHEKSGFMPPAGFLEFLQAAQGRMEAIARLEEEVRQAPDKVDKVLELAHTYLELGRTGDALALLEKAEAHLDAVDSDTTKGDYAFALGLAYLIEGAYDKGVERLEALIAAHPEHAEAERVKEMIPRGKLFGAMARVDQGDYEAARAILTELQETSTDEQVTAFAGEVLERLEVLGRPAPAWTASWVDSKPASLEKMKGSVVALAFLNPGDSSSAEIASTLESLRQAHGARGFVPVAIVSLPDASKEAATGDVKAWAGKQGVTYPIGADLQGHTTFDQYKGEEIPWVALIGRDGLVHYLGAYSKAEFDGKLVTLLDAER